MTASIERNKSIGLKIYEPLVVIMDDNPYTILGVTKDATDAEIKRVYRKLARQYHQIEIQMTQQLKRDLSRFKLHTIA